MRVCGAYWACALARFVPFTLTMRGLIWSSPLRWILRLVVRWRVLWSLRWNLSVWLVFGIHILPMCFLMRRVMTLRGVWALASAPLPQVTDSVFALRVSPQFSLQNSTPSSALSNIFLGFAFHPLLCLPILCRPFTVNCGIPLADLFSAIDQDYRAWCRVLWPYAGSLPGCSDYINRVTFKTPRQ